MDHLWPYMYGHLNGRQIKKNGHLNGWNIYCPSIYGHIIWLLNPARVTEGQKIKRVKKKLPHSNTFVIMIIIILNKLTILLFI